MKLTALQYGKTELPAHMAFPDGTPDNKLPISLLFFLLEIDNRSILIDTGCDTMPGFPLLEHQSPVEVLECTGVRRHDITEVYLTHSHHDHADGVRYYPQADIYIHETELNAAKPYLNDLPHVHTFSQGVHIADGIELLHIGGHSPGSSIISVKTAEETLVLCGDECYTRENLLRGIPTASSFCPPRSRAFIDEYRKPCYRTVLFHDPALVGEIGAKILLDDSTRIRP